MSRTDVIAHTLTELAAPICARHGVELVDVRLVTEHGEHVARIVIDRERADGLPGSAVSLEDCQGVSRDLSAKIDEDPEVVPGAFRLEVSSPGLERPLVRLADYDRFVGREAKIKVFKPINGQRTFDGVLLGTDGADVRIDCAGTTVVVPHGEITKAHLVHRFK